MSTCIESLPLQELLAFTQNPAALRVLDAIIDGLTIPAQSAVFAASVGWEHIPRTLSMTASVAESARASGWRQTHISNYAGYSWLCVGPND